MDLDPQAKRMLELTRQARSPSVRDKARVDRLLAGVLVPVASTAHAATGTTSKTVGSAAAFKWTGIAIFAIAGGAGFLGWRVSHREPAPARAPVATVTHLSAPSEPENTGDVRVIAPAASEPVAATRSDALEEELAPKAVRSRGASRSSVQPRVEGTLPEELDLLHDAQSKWRAGDAASALSLLAVHRKRYPRSQLGPERDALTVVSLCATNRKAQARKVARRFLRTAQSSPLKTSVEESCAAR
jgi:hypothetical protein